MYVCMYVCMYCLIALARALKAMLDRRVESGHPCLVPDLKRKFFPIQSFIIMMLAAHFCGWLNFFTPHMRICLLIWERERETLMWERNINQFPPMCTPTGYWTHNLGMCPEWDSNLQPFGVQDNVPINWATQPGINNFYKIKENSFYS